MLYALLASLVLTSAADGLAPIQPTDFTRLRSIHGVEISDDGRFAIYLVRSIEGAFGDRDEKPGYRTNLFRIDLDREDATPVQLTFGKTRCSSPTIRPGGSHIAFVRGKEDLTQVWLMPVEGGEAQALTSLEHGASSPSWSPRGGRLLVTSSIPESDLDVPPEFRPRRPGSSRLTPADGDAEPSADPDGDLAAIRKWLNGNGDENDPRVINRIRFQGERGLRDERTVAQLFVIDTQTGDAQQITSGPYDHSSAIWSPDGAEILFRDSGRVGTHPDFLNDDALYRMPGGGGEWTVVHQSFDIGRARFAPVGELFVTAAIGDAQYRLRSLMSMTRDGALTNLHPSLEVSVGDHRPTSTGVWFTASRRGSTPLYHRDASGVITRHSGDFQVVGAFDAIGDRAVASLSTTANPTELFLFERGAAPRRLTDLHESWLATRRVSLPVERWVTREDGTSVQSWVLPPAEKPARGARAPTVLEMHGGPTVMWSPASFSMWHEFQLLCARGYGVVFANPRGSAGYGRAHRLGNHQDWGHGPAGDVLAALDAAIQDHEWIDPDQLFLTGGSYAGYLTAWIVAQDHRFKAAVAQRGVYDLETFFGEGNAYTLVERAFGGFPWTEEIAPILERESPFTHVANVKTPLLIMHADRDLRTGVSQSEMLYRALKQQWKPVEYIRYPRAGHDLSRTGEPWQRLDRLLRIVEFFERHRAPPPAAIETSAPKRTGAQSKR